MADEILHHGVKSISDLITISGEINVDFADVRTIMEDAGVALMGIGIASGDERAKVAASNAISCPLLEEVSIEGATGVLVNVTGPSDMLLYELDDAMNVVYETVSEDADVIFGLVYDEERDEEFEVTVIATGFAAEEAKQIEGTKTLDIDNFVSQNFMKRRAERQPKTRQKRRQRPTRRKSNSSTDDEDLDVPTFLRIRSREEK